MRKIIVSCQTWTLESWEQPFSGSQNSYRFPPPETLPLQRNISCALQVWSFTLFSSCRCRCLCHKVQMREAAMWQMLPAWPEPRKTAGPPFDAAQPPMRPFLTAAQLKMWIMAFTWSSPPPSWFMARTERACECCHSRDRAEVVGGPTDDQISVVRSSVSIVGSNLSPYH